MDVVRGSLREFGWLLSTMTGGVPDGEARPQPPRGARWIAIQVLALALTLAVLFVLGELFWDPPAAGTVATTATWFLPAFWLALPLAIHWFAGPPRRAAGLLAALVTGVCLAVGFAGVVAWLPGPWAGLLTLTVGASGAAVVYGVVSPIPARP